MINNSEALRRWLGMFCLATAAGMLIWGRTLLMPHLNGWLFYAYWSACIGFASTAVGVAMVDIFAIRAECRREHRELVRQTFERIKSGEEDRS